MLLRGRGTWQRLNAQLGVSKSIRNMKLRRQTREFLSRILCNSPSMMRETEKQSKRTSASQSGISQR